MGLDTEQTLDWRSWNECRLVEGSDGSPCSHGQKDVDGVYLGGRLDSTCQWAGYWGGT